MPALRKNQSPVALGDEPGPEDVFKENFCLAGFEIKEAGHVIETNALNEVGPGALHIPWQREFACVS